MPELRKDPIVGRWVIVAESRSQRPNDFTQSAASRSACPFCAGNEDQTPPEILAYRADSPANGPGWRVRVVPNKYPALEREADFAPGPSSLYERQAGVGAHEVIIETPEHLTSTAAVSEPQLAEVYWAYRDRLLDLQRDPRLVYGMVFRNVGPAAGASLEHVHSQLIATPIVPVSVAEELAGAADYYARQNRCVYCDVLEQELADGQRVVYETAEFAAFCPFASRLPFETWVVPKQHHSHYELLTRPLADELAHVMRWVMAKLESALDRPAYNHIIHTAPFDTQQLRHYHWHIEIMPRLTHVAGFEWGSGFFINPVPPHEAAAVLRSAEVFSSGPSTTLTDRSRTKPSTTAQSMKDA